MKKNKMILFTFFLIIFIFITQFYTSNILNFWKTICSSLMITYLIDELIKKYEKESDFKIKEKYESIFYIITFFFSVITYLSLFILLPYSLLNIYTYVCVSYIKNILISIAVFMMFLFCYLLSLYYLLDDTYVEDEEKNE